MSQQPSVRGGDPQNLSPSVFLTFSAVMRHSVFLFLSPHWENVVKLARTARWIHV